MIVDKVNGLPVVPSTEQAQEGITPQTNNSTAAPELHGDTTAAIAFLKDYTAGWPDHQFVQLVAIAPKQSKNDPSQIDARTVPPSKIDSSAPWIDKYQGRRGIYFCPNPLRHYVPTKAAGTDIAALAYLHSDNDPHDHEPLDKEHERLLGDVRDFRIKPTALISSGNGLGVFFRLAKPLPADGSEEHAKQLAVMNQRLAKHFGGDKCHAICQVMRLPGTINLPSYSKLAKGRSPVPVLAKLLEWNDTSNALEKFNFLPAAAAPVPMVNKQPIEFYPADVDEAALAARLQAVQSDPELAKLLNGEPLSWMGDTSRNGFDFAFALVLCRLGFTDDEIAFLLLQYPYGKMSDRKEEDAEKDIARILGKVHIKLGGTNGSAIDMPVVSPALHLCTDLANAKRLKQAAGGNILYSAGQFLIWNGSYWEANEDAAYRQTFSLSALIKAEAHEWENKAADSEEERKLNNKIAEDLRKWGIKSEMEHQLNAAFHLLRRQVGVPADTLDSGPYLLNVLNGTVDLRTGKLRPHDRGDRITKIIPIAYYPDSKASLFEKTLAEITGEAGLAHKPIAAFMQSWFGYCATGLTDEQKFAVHHGSGANGKSLLLSTVERVLGPYAGVAAPNLLVGGAQDQHPTGIADLRGKRMVTAHESEENGKLNEGFIKRATGGDRISARRMRQDHFEFDPTHKLQLLTNHKPQIRGQDHAIWRRVLLIPYNTTFGTAAAVAAHEAHHVKNEALSEALKAEAEGILAWIVKGARHWHMAGLNPPDAVLAAGAAYREEQDRVGQFLTECCERDPDVWTPLSGKYVGLYQSYKEWVARNGYLHLGRGNFQEALEKRPGIRKEERHYDTGGRRTRGVGYWGIRLVVFSQ